MDERTILDALYNKLTGNIEIDYEFLVKEADHFKNLGLTSITSKILMLMEQKYGDDGKKFLLEKAKSFIEKRKQKFKEAILFKKNQEYDKAIELVVELLDTFPFNTPKNVKLVSFNSFFESVLYEAFINTDKSKIRIAEEPIANYYFVLAHSEFLLKDYDSTLEYLKILLEYNPVSPDAYVLMSEVYLELGDVDSFFKKGINKALEYAYNCYQLAHTYVQLTKYFISINRKDLSIICATLANSFAKSRVTKHLDAKIQALEGEDVDMKNTIEIQQKFADINLQLGPSKKVLSLLIKIIEDKNYNIKEVTKVYFLQLLYEITNDPKILERIRNFKEGEKNE